MATPPLAPLFRSLLKLGALVLSLGAAGRMIYRTSDAYRDLVPVGLGVLALAAAVGILAVARPPRGRPFVRLFDPGRSRLGEVLHVLSFFTFADPGEVSWHAVENARRDASARSPLNSALLYVLLAMPAALLLDWLLLDVPLLTVASAIYLAPWSAIRMLEEMARRRS
jgi:hypothetical protein